jgi:GMP synthase-like glutamine amidotransferase
MPGYVEIGIINSGDNANLPNIEPIIFLLGEAQIKRNYDFRIAVYSYKDLGKLESYCKKAQLLIFSGRDPHDPPHKNSEILKYYSWIGKINLPVLTICGSYQRWLIAQGASLIKDGSESAPGFVPIKMEISKDDDIHKNLKAKKVYVYSEHQYFIKPGSLPPNIQVIGMSTNGISIVKNRTKPFYGFQGHPERAYLESDDKDRPEAKKYSDHFFTELIDLSIKNGSHGNDR